MDKNFCLIGAAGYIAPKHMKAIKETGNNLLAVLDPSDSVGIIDSYFPNADFFTEFERFDRHIEKLKYDEKKLVDYVSICSPNYLHDSHIRFALRSGANAVCEKPLVLNPWNIDKLKKIEESTSKKIYNILQLRAHPTILKLRKQVLSNSVNKKYDIELKYITSRGNWYKSSWKGDENKSGGIATNIGIHFFDMLHWVFGRTQINRVNRKEENYIEGYLELENARINWFLSIDSSFLPKNVLAHGGSTFRSIKLNNKEIEFSRGFKDLHTRVYEDILTGKGYGLEDVRPSIEIVHKIRNS
tara:strand:- start:4429 stop:5328 length:900 start_codon:yes stop_codon:yes gene_type:complete